MIRYNMMFVDRHDFCFSCFQGEELTSKLTVNFLVRGSSI